MFADEVRAARSVRAFERIAVDDRLVVFFSESKEDWGDLSPLVSRLILAQNRSVAYLTSDPEDPALSRITKNLHVFYVGRGRARQSVFKKLDANLVVVARPVVGSIIPVSSVTTVHYSLILSTLQSVTTTHSAEELAPYQSVFCSGPHQAAEIRDLMHPDTKILQLGNGRLDAILERRRRVPEEVLAFKTASVLVAPQEASFFKNAGYSIVERLLRDNLKVVVHLHPGLTKRARIAKKLERKFGSSPNFSVNTSLPSFSLIFMSQTVITDWSDIALQYSLGMERPVIFIDLPRPDRRAVGSTNRRPLEVALRPQLGQVVARDRISQIAKICRATMNDSSQEALAELRRRVVFNSNISGAIGSAAVEALTLRHDPQAALDRAIRDLKSKDSGAA